MIVIQNLCKKFGDFTVIDDFSLDVETGSITSILAPSGAGKTTLLRLISGLEKPTSGRVLLNGKEVVQSNPQIGFMFQESSAFPWLTVRGNVEFGLKLKTNRDKFNADEASDQVVKICRELNIERLLDLYPIQLSGGQKQRVVIARSLILRPEIILCDEPFSALDEITRGDLRELLLDLHRRHAPTIIFITHSVEEAVFIGNHLIICSGPPLRVVEKMKVEFNSSRSRNLLDDKDFIMTKLKVKRILAELN